MAIGTSHWDSPLLGLGCLSVKLGLGLVPFLGPNSDWNLVPVGSVSPQVGTVWPCPNFAFCLFVTVPIAIGALGFVPTLFGTP